MLAFVLTYAKLKALKMTPADVKKKTTKAVMFQRKPRNGESLQIWTKPKWNQKWNHSNADSNVALPESVFKFIMRCNKNICFSSSAVEIPDWIDMAAL